MTKDTSTLRTLLWDIISLLPGLLLLTLADWLTLIAAGLPFMGGLLFVRRYFWRERPVQGRIAIGLLFPVLTLSTVALFVFGRPGLLLGLLIAAVLAAVFDIVWRRFGDSFVRSRPLATTVGFLVLGAVINISLLTHGVIQLPAENILKGLSMTPAAPAWTEQAKQQAVHVVHETVRYSHLTLSPDELPRELLASSAALTSEESNLGIYVTLYNDRGRRVRGFARTTKGPLSDLVVATQNAMKQTPKAPHTKRKTRVNWEREFDTLRIQIDVLGPMSDVRSRLIFPLFAELFRGGDKGLRRLKGLDTLLNLSFEIEPGVDGILVDFPDLDSAAILLPSDVVTEGILTPRVRSGAAKVGRMLERAAKQHVRGFDIEKDQFTVSKFRTQCFGRIGSGGKVLDWYRGNVLLPRGLGRELLISRINLAADWLSRQMKGKGKFHYEIMPPIKRGSGAYNLPRHAGSVYGLFAFYNLSRDRPEFKEAGLRALKAGLKGVSYIYANLGSPDAKREPSMKCFLKESGSADSGSTALAALALSELPRPEEVADPAIRRELETLWKDQWMDGLGTCLLKMIDPDGRVFYSYKEATSNEFVKKEPLYYPGELMLALVQMYKLSKDERFLRGAELVGTRRLDNFGWSRRLQIPIAGDHWVMQALAELSDVTADDQFAELAVLMGIGSILTQVPQQAHLYQDYFGAYRRVADVPRTTRAGSRGEALGGSLAAAKMLGRDTAPFQQALIDGARHLIEQQFVEDNSYFVPKGWDVQGAIRMGLVDNHCRIDNNQHALVGMIRALEAMEMDSD